MITTILTVGEVIETDNSALIELYIYTTNKPMIKRYITAMGLFDKIGVVDNIQQQSVRITYGDIVLTSSDTIDEHTFYILALNVINKEGTLYPNSINDIDDSAILRLQDFSQKTLIKYKEHKLAVARMYKKAQ